MTVQFRNKFDNMNKTYTECILNTVILTVKMPTLIIITKAGALSVDSSKYASLVVSIVSRCKMLLLIEVSVGQASQLSNMLR